MASTSCPQDLPKSRGSTSKGNRRGWLCVAFTITVVACLLCQCGDIEMNPGPGCEFRVGEGKEGRNEKEEKSGMSVLERLWG